MRDDIHAHRALLDRRWPRRVSWAGSALGFVRLF